MRKQSSVGDERRAYMLLKNNETPLTPASATSVCRITNLNSNYNPVNNITRKPSVNNLALTVCLTLSRQAFRDADRFGLLTAPNAAAEPAKLCAHAWYNFACRQLYNLYNWDVCLESSQQVQFFHYSWSFSTLVWNSDDENRLTKTKWGSDEVAQEDWKLLSW